MCDYCVKLNKLLCGDTMSVCDSDSDIGSDTYRSESDLYPAENRITLIRFQLSIFPIIKGKSKLEASIHWGQIKNFIKGSVEALLQRKDLTLEQYCNEKVFHLKRVKITTEERLDVYAVYERYKALCAKEKFWDDVDKAEGVQRITNRKRGLKKSPSNQALSLTRKANGSIKEEKNCWAVFCLA